MSARKDRTMKHACGHCGKHNQGRYVIVEKNGRKVYVCKACCLKWLVGSKIG